MSLIDHFSLADADLLQEEARQADAFFLATEMWRSPAADSSFAEDQWQAADKRINAISVKHGWSDFQRLYAKSWLLRTIHSVFHPVSGDVVFFMQLPWNAAMIERIAIEAECLRADGPRLSHRI